MNDIFCKWLNMNFPPLAAVFKFLKGEKHTQMMFLKSAYHEQYEAALSAEGRALKRFL